MSWLGMAVHSLNPTSQEAEVDRSLRIQGYLVYIVSSRSDYISVSISISTQSYIVRPCLRRGRGGGLGSQPTQTTQQWGVGN